MALESGAIVGASSIPSIYDAAKNDNLSGTYNYDVYAASGGELARLLSAGLLEDISLNQYINSKHEWFDENLTDALSVYGGKYLISSSLTDTYSETFVLAYNKALCDADALISAANSGSLTFEMLLETAVADDENYTFDLDNGDIFPLYVSAGGWFATASDKLEITSLDVLNESLDKLSGIISDADMNEGSDLFYAGGTQFAIMTLGEVKALRAEGMDIGVLPLPKYSEEDEYRSFVKISDTELLALPKGHSDLDKTSYLIYRMAFLSMGYILPSYYEGFEESDLKMLRLIAENAVCDMSDLFGYGDIGGLIEDSFLGESSRLTLEYYNRKNLYEKAFEIIQKRLNNQE